MNRIAAITHCSGEGKYLLEWCAWLSLLGVCRVFIYEHNNPQTPEFLTTKATLESIGFAEFHPAVETKRTANLQMDDMLAAAELCEAQGIGWLLTIDLDEYPVITRHANLLALIDALPDCVSQILLNWRLYGSSDEMTFDAERTHFEKFRHHAVVNHQVHRLGKSCFKVAALRTMHLHVHEVEGVTVTGALERFSGASHPHGTKEPCYEVGWLCHFAVRSRAEFEEKLQRGYPDAWHGEFPGERYWTNRNLNHVEGPDLDAQGAMIRARVAAWGEGTAELAPVTTRIENGRLKAVHPDVFPKVPEFVPLWRVKAVLEMDGRLEQIAAIIEGMPADHAEVIAIRNAWAGNSDLERAAVSTGKIATLAGMTDGEVDGLFLRAAGLRV